MTEKASRKDPGPVLVRLFHVVTYLLILAAVRFVLWGTLLFQLICHFVGVAPHEGASKLGFVVADYVYRIWLYLTYSTDERPFPFRNRSESDPHDH